MKKRQVLKLARLAVLACAMPVAAMAGDTGTLYTQLSTNGLGLGYAMSLNDDWAARGQYNSYKRSFSGDVGDYGSSANMQLDLTLSSFEVLGDWYPGSGGFRFSGGVVFNDNKITLTGTNANVGSASGQTVSGQIKMSKSPSPYLGIGYSVRPKAGKGFGFTFDFGVMRQDPQLTLTASGASQADIDAQIASSQDALNKLKNMPVIGLGLSYSF